MRYFPRQDCLHFCLLQLKNRLHWTSHQNPILHSPVYPPKHPVKPPLSSISFAWSWKIFPMFYRAHDEFFANCPPCGGHWGVEQFQQYMRKHFWFLKCFEHKLVAKYCEASSAKIVFFFILFYTPNANCNFCSFSKIGFQAFRVSC